jgi:hypothetical protein
LNTNYQWEWIPKHKSLVGGIRMDKNKEKTQTYAGSFQGVADDRKDKIDELKEKNLLDD